MKILILLLLLGPFLAFTFSPNSVIHAEEQQKEKKKKGDKKSKNKQANIKTGGRFYKDSKIKLSSTDETATFQGTSYQAILDSKGVIHIYLKNGDETDKKPAILTEIMWEDGKDKKANESLLTSMTFKEKSPEEWEFSGAFGDIKGTFEMNVSFKGNSIEIQSDASAKKQGELKITFTVTNLTALYKKDDDKTTKAAKEAYFIATNTKNKDVKVDYEHGKLKDMASQKFDSIQLKNHFPSKEITFQSTKTDGHLDIKAYGGGSWLKEGFNVRYQTSSSGKINLEKNKIIILL